MTVYNKKVVFSFVLMLVGCCYLTAQDESHVSSNFSKTPFQQFVKQIELKTNCHFYYDIDQLDTLTITIITENISLNDLLITVFKNTGFYFSIDSDKNIFITRLFSIQTNINKILFSINDTVSIPIIDLHSLSGKKTEQKEIIEKTLFEIGEKKSALLKGKFTVAGYVRDSKTGEPLTGVLLYNDSPYVAAVTDRFGYYNITLPAGLNEVQVTNAGKKNTKKKIMLFSDGKLNIELEDNITTLKNITIISNKNSNTRNLQMGAEKLSINTIKQVPVVFGETDVLRAVLTMPGVTSVGEASTGFNVRGGATDQNLILLNDATIYNPSHLFGFFSAFNPDIIKNVELYKSAIPEKYGGRLSSVLDVTGKDGNTKKLSGTGGIGLLTSRLQIEGPLKKDKTTFVAAGRTTYSNWLLKAIPNSAYNRSKASFNDFNLRISHIINEKNTFFINGYMSNDRFNLNNDTTYKYKNRNFNIKWKHNFTSKFYGTFSTGSDHYKYDIASNENPTNAFMSGFNIRQLFFKTDLAYSQGSKHYFSFGQSTIYYKVDPGYLIPKGGESLTKTEKLQQEKALENSLYFGDKITVSPKLSINAGIRLNIYNYLGPRSVYKYVPGIPREEATITDTVYFKKGQSINTYYGAEYRIAARYLLSNNSSVKASFNTLNQFIHSVSNTAAISPTDIWKLSDSYIKPQKGLQASIGYYHNFESKKIETSLELYYKKIKNFLDYKSGASLILNHHIETDIINTRGKAYGAELLIKKTDGRLSGWASYTYSRTLLQQDDELAGQTINGGQYYPANYDKPNSINLFLNYQFSHRFTISLNSVYSTGRPITLPIAIYSLAGSQRVFYSNRNQYRVPDYYRTDLSVNIDGNHKTKQSVHNSWSFGVYNLLSRQNPYSIYFIQENGIIKGYQLSIFGTAIPFISYNFRF